MRRRRSRLRRCTARDNCEVRRGFVGIEGKRRPQVAGTRRDALPAGFRCAPQLSTPERRPSTPHHVLPPVALPALFALFAAVIQRYSRFADPAVRVSFQKFVRQAAFNCGTLPDAAGRPVGDRVQQCLASISYREHIDQGELLFGPLHSLSPSTNGRSLQDTSPLQGFCRADHV